MPQSPPCLTRRRAFLYLRPHFVVKKPDGKNSQQPISLGRLPSRLQSANLSHSPQEAIPEPTLPAPIVIYGYSLL